MGQYRPIWIKDWQPKTLDGWAKGGMALRPKRVKQKSLNCFKYYTP